MYRQPTFNAELHLKCYPFTRLSARLRILRRSSLPFPILSHPSQRRNSTQLSACLYSVRIFPASASGFIVPTQYRLSRIQRNLLERGHLDNWRLSLLVIFDPMPTILIPFSALQSPNKFSVITPKLSRSLMASTDSAWAATFARATEIITLSSDRVLGNIFKGLHGIL
ncbi:hypothetical protein K443DRAFT_595996 [Laccaria amethystina LaAM-08-1]|uniref:Uncharacterized protein n=1 Tax=Laccaria amethystina LaAM-08-1 TaxID=1095629 RepID=A0A0C9X6P6_9AGAR|nr:hypothetical protein K443DRAFT_595996 [Laccaria amethystina LaAM-08-1]